MRINQIVSRPEYIRSRRKTLSTFAAIATGSICSHFGSAQPFLRSEAIENSTGPTFSKGGPNAKLYGFDEGYPVPGVRRAVSEGNPWEPKYRVGAFSHIDEIYTTRKVSRADVPWTFKRSTGEVRYRFQGRQSSLTDYLARNPVTGLLIARGDQILFEHYQYGRTDQDRLLSQSMAKSIIGLLIGLAIADGAIKSMVNFALGIR